ncbi:MAG: ornithine cyclodeaminase family protein [Acidobacteria bacterium]|nr:ornithine cyclodeaminase family protein [Acidobacteriota bacterium]MBI3281642.1 ornithine cyclodeaminase family protein [Acidobacteriota bacterium]
MRLFIEDEVRGLLPMRECIEALRAAFKAFAEGEAQNQPRRRLFLPSGAVLHAMAGACGPYFGTKVYSTHPRHGAAFTVILYSADTGKPLAQFEANYLGQIRTGAATGLACDLLAPPAASTAGLIGSGFQARSQLEAVLAVRKLKAVTVWSRSAEHRAEFAREASGRFQIDVRATASPEEAARGCDIVVTATSAKDPVLEAAWIQSGALVCAMGSNHPRRRELPADLVRTAARIVADDPAQARLEAGDLLLALDQAGWTRVEPLAGVTPNTRVPGITIFKSVGLGLEDVAAAALVWEKAATLAR